MNILAVLDRPIAFQRVFVKLTDSINAALMLSQAVYWSSRTDDPAGWFWKTQGQWEDETGLTRREQDGARKILDGDGLGFLLEEKRGIPPKIYYRVDLERVNENLERHMHQSAKLDAPSVHESTTLTAPKRQHVCTKTPTRMHQNANLLITETTQRLSETTEEKRPAEQRPPVEQNYDVSADPGDVVPEGLQPLQYAAGLLEHCSIPSSSRLLDQVAQSIRYLAKQGRVELNEATRLMIRRVGAAQGRGETVTYFWFADQKWKKSEGAAQLPVDGKAIAAEAFRRNMHADRSAGR